MPFIHADIPRSESTVLLGAATVAAGAPIIDPHEMANRLEAEKFKRKPCKALINKELASPVGAVRCDKTEARISEHIETRVVGDDYALGIGHTKWSFSVNPKQDEVAKSRPSDSARVRFAEHVVAFAAGIKDPGKGLALQPKASLPQVVPIENGEATSATFDSIETEDSEAAAAEVSSIMALDKLLGLTPKPPTTELDALTVHQLQRGWRRERIGDVPLGAAVAVNSFTTTERRREKHVRREPQFAK